MGRAATRRASATEGSRPAADPWGRSSFSASFSPYALVTRETEPRPPRRRVDSLAKRTEYLRRSSALAAGSFGRYAGSKPLTRTRRERGAPPLLRHRTTQTSRTDIQGERRRQDQGGKVEGNPVPAPDALCARRVNRGLPGYGGDRHEAGHRLLQTQSSPAHNS